MSYLWLMFIVTTAVVGPAMLSGTAIRRLKGWARGLAVPVLLIGLTALPWLWLDPRISMANKSSPDMGGYIGLCMVFLMMVILLSTLVGFAVGGVVVYRRNRTPA